ncbi:hypothetical protein TRICI_003991 [Trichomonascus ciferrii]|uniref:Ribosomal protein L1 n=1 Tax=Trichomonascus ciferrii TaxID=44093 RepID=A0A642V2A5_9ASCO|nr:hypothetical protein TRICI_003991 [Trichomonascus ciferrii]
MDGRLMSIERSIKALVSHAGAAEPVYLQMTLMEPYVTKRNPVPVLFQLPNKLQSLLEREVCLVVRDPQQSVVDVLEKKGAPTEDLFKEIISVKKLKNRVRSKKQLDEFFKSFDLVVCDEKVSHLLPEILGAHFYKSGKNMPIPIKMAKPESPKNSVDPKYVKYQLKAINHSTALALTPGTCLSCLVGYTDMDTDRLVRNYQAIQKKLLEKFNGSKPKLTIRKIHVKTPESASLPTYP